LDQETRVLYKVTPMMTPVEAKKPASDPNAPPKEARKRRKSAVFDADGNEVLITMMCLKCRSMKPLAMFGLRKMADGAIRNQPWCRTCRSGAGTKKKADEVVETPEAGAVVEAAPVAPAVIEEKDESRALIEQLVNGPPPA
jgi:hypothetical protein